MGLGAEEGGVKEKECKTSDEQNFFLVTEQPPQFCRSSVQFDAH